MCIQTIRMEYAHMNNTPETTRNAHTYHKKASFPSPVLHSIVIIGLYIFNL